MIPNIDNMKIRQKLIFIEDNVLKLKDLKNLSEGDFLDDYRNVFSVKYLLQTSIEAMLDIANHIVARNKWGKIESNRDSFEILAQKGYISKDDVETYFLMAKFRNRIVHMYMDIDDSTIYRILQKNVADIEKFVKNISTNI